MSTAALAVPRYPVALRVQLVREGGPLAGALEGPRPVLANPADTARLLLPWARQYCDSGSEVFGVALLDARHRLIGLVQISTGCLTASLVHPREVFGAAVAGKAAAILLWHTHPSGDPEPSAEDVALTRRLSAAGSLMGIEVLDHLVLGLAWDGGADRWASLKDRGVL